MKARLVALAAIGLLALTGCSQKGVRAPCPDGKVCLEVGNGTDPLSLDPHKITGTWEDRIVGDMMVGLTQADINGKPIPGMAESWETSADGLTWTFHLRDAQWSDGAPVTADDFVFALRRILTPATAAEYASLLYFIKGAEPINAGEAPPETLGVRAIDARTLEINLEHPAPYLLELAKHQTMYPVPKHVVEKYGVDWSNPEHLVVNGPYKVTFWRLKDRIVAEKNPLFWDADQVCIDRVTYYPTEDAVSAERQVRRNELDMQNGIPSNRLAYLTRHNELTDYIHTNTYLGVTYVFFNANREIFKDKRVRQALSMAIDRDFLTEGVMMKSGGVSAYTFVPPGVANYSAPPSPAWSTWTLEQRKTEARKLLAAAGYGPNNPLTFEVKHRGLEASAFMALLQSDWRDIGVEAKLIGSESAVAYQAYRVRDFDMGDGGWIADYNDANSFLFLMHSSSGPMNYGDYNNPDYDRLLGLADNEPDLAKRADYLRQAESIVLDDTPIIPIYFLANNNLVSPRVTGFVDNITDVHRTRYMCLK